MFSFPPDQDQLMTDLRSRHLKNPQGVICIRGPTASGKTNLSIQTSRFFAQHDQICEIISADSRQVYMAMDIGTDKVSPEIRKEIVHHQIDIVSPDQTYTAGQWKQDTDQLIQQIHANQHCPIIVGGTGLYIDTIYHNFTLPSVPADPHYRQYLEKMESDQPGILHKLLAELDPEDAQNHHPHSIRFIIRSLEIYHQTGQTKSSLFHKQELPYPLLMLGLMPSARYSNHLIDLRVDQMMQEGLIDEVQSLLSQGYDRQCVALNGIGYGEIVDYLEGWVNVTEATRLIKQHSHQYAKKQRTWMRKYLADSQKNPIKGVDYMIFADREHMR